MKGSSSNYRLLGKKDDKAKRKRNENCETALQEEKAEFEHVKGRNNYAYTVQFSPHSHTWFICLQKTM